ncbi:MAG TPA: DUF3180 domain-containing protein [Candidatus Luteococcus avicola]|nr:DUF3180 domain-containing protein [Candidatus Luteococcus avicola]
MTSGDGDGRLGLTTRMQAIVMTLVGGAFGYLVLGLFDLTNRTIPVTPWSMPMIFFALAVAALLYSRGLARQVREARDSLEHEAGLRALVLGKTLIATGLALTGWHLVYLMHFVGQWSVEGPRQRIIRGLTTVLVSALVAFAGWRLERACLVDPGDDDPDGEAR